MQIKNELNKNNIDFKVLDEDKDFVLYKIQDRLVLLHMLCKSSDFIMERDIFEYIDSNKLEYRIICENTSSGKMFYLKFPNKNNWIKGAFESCSKQKLHLGKQVLNNQMKLIDIASNLKR